jgi:hypothetical protein
MQSKYMAWDGVGKLCVITLDLAFEAFGVFFPCIFSHLKVRVEGTFFFNNTQLSCGWLKLSFLF